MASIHSKEENDFVFSLLLSPEQRDGDQATYLGGKVVGDQHVWDDGTPVDYGNWYSGG